MTPPAAILEMIFRYFGGSDQPFYGRTLEILERDPYRAVRDALAVAYPIEDYTDYNSDLGMAYVPVGHPMEITVRLSFVGPFAVIIDSAGHLRQPPDIVDILVSAGFQLLEQQVLESEVHTWAPTAIGTVYEFLFEFDNGIPWLADDVDE